MPDEDRAVSTRQAEEWCRSHGSMPYLEVSAKSDANVSEAFQIAADLAMRNRPQQGPGAGFEGNQEVDLLSSNQTTDGDTCPC
jgi:Ras-related protein Rab-7A